MRRVLLAAPPALLLFLCAALPAAGQEEWAGRRRAKVVRSLSELEKENFKAFLLEADRPRKAERQGLLALECLLKLRNLRDGPRSDESERGRQSLLGDLGSALQEMGPDTRDAFLGRFGDLLAEAGLSPDGPGAGPGMPGPRPGFDGPGPILPPWSPGEPVVRGPAAPPASAAPPEPPRNPGKGSSGGKTPGLREAMLAAEDALRRGEYDLAVEHASQAIRQDPDLAAAYAFRAAGLAAGGNVPEAVSEIETASRLDPKDGLILTLRAFVMNRALRNKEAKEAAEEAIRRRADFPWTWYQLAFAQAALHDPKGSRRSLQRAARLDPANFEGKLRAANDTKFDEELPIVMKDPMLQAGIPRPGDRFQGRGAARLLAPLFLLGLLASPFAALFLLRRRIAAWIVRQGAAGQPAPPTPLVGLTPPAPQTPLKAGEIAPTPGRIPTGYRILRQIGAGGMGAVFEAEDLSLERRVAIKRMRDEIKLDPGECERFLKEARTVAKLHHPSIVEIYAIVEFEGEILLVFEYLDGATLDSLLRKHGRFSVAQARGVLRQVCAALGYAHERGVIHRDLKPSNIMVTRELLVKVMDFGVARLAKDAMSRLSMTNTVAGTPPYMAPEAETGMVRKESDLYSLGICLYEMLAGARPFEGTGAGMLLNKMNMRYEPASSRAQGVPPGLDAFLAGALNADPDKRPRSAAEFLAEFEKAAGGA